jgi:hypothetical protein
MRAPDAIRIRVFDGLRTKFFRGENRASTIACGASAAPLQTLPSGSTRVVHEFSDMDEMPISQGFLESFAERARRDRSRASKCAPTSSRRVVTTCRDAAGSGGYTFR